MQRAHTYEEAEGKLLRDARCMLQDYNQHWPTSGLGSMPVLITSAPMSSSTASSCAFTLSTYDTTIAALGHGYLCMSPVARANSADGVPVAGANAAQILVYYQRMQ